jgi:hypothetical protein
VGGTFSRSWEIVKQSFAVLRKDKELVLFPIISGVATFLLLAAFMAPAWLLSGAGESGQVEGFWFYLFFFIFYFAASFVVIFFNTGLIACAQIRFSGGDPTFADGIRYASQHLGSILGWSIISASVGLILKAIRERGGLVGAIAAGIMDVAWNLITFFVIPVMIFERMGVFASIKKSSGLFRKTWGENMVVRFSVGLIFFLLGLVGIAPIALVAATRSLPIIVIVSVVVVLYWAALAIMSAALTGIFSVALYNYASTGALPAVYSQDLVVGAFQPKRKRGLLGR